MKANRHKGSGRPGAAVHYVTVQFKRKVNKKNRVRENGNSK